MGYHKILSYLLLAIHGRVAYQSPRLFTYKTLFGIFKGHWSSQSLEHLNNELMLPSAVILESEPLSTAHTGVVTMLWLLQWSKDIRKAFLKLNHCSLDKTPIIYEVRGWGSISSQARSKVAVLKAPVFLPNSMTKINSRYHHSLQTFPTWVTQIKHRSHVE